MAYLYLLLAILSEVTGSLLLRVSHGFERLGYGVGALLFFVLSLGLLSLAIKTIPISVSYPLSTGLGTLGALLGGHLLFAERVTVLHLVGVVTLLLGVMMVQFAQVRA